MRLRRPVVCAALLALSGCGGHAPLDTANPVVEVTTQQPGEGVLPDLLAAYGTATPGINGTTSVTVQVDGRVAAVRATPGEIVKAGQPLLDFEISAAAASAHEQASATVRLAQADEARTERLLVQKLATQSQFAAAKKSLGDAQSSLAALDHEYGGKPLQHFMAPFDGIVVAMPVAQGARVPAGTLLFSIMRPDRLLVTAGVEPSERQKIVPGENVTLAPLDGTGAAQSGEVVRIDGILNPVTRLVDVDVKTADPILPGAAYRLAIQVGQHSGWLMPRGAVLTDLQGAYVYQVAGDKSHRVPVMVLGEDDATIVVRGDLDPQRPLVTSGNYQLSEGMRVRQLGSDK